MFAHAKHAVRSYVLLLGAKGVLDGNGWVMITNWSFRGIGVECFWC